MRDHEQQGPLADRASGVGGTNLARTWLTSLALGCGAFLVYISNGHDIGTEDIQPSTLLPHALASGDGLALDRFGFLFGEREGDMLACVARKRGVTVSRYPIATPMLATPFIWIQRVAYDRWRPGWRADAGLEWRHALDMAKNAAAVLTAITILGIHRLLLALGFSRVALAASVAAAFGSSLWTIGSQSLWQHGPAALALTFSLLALSGDSRYGRARHLAAGVCAGVLVAVRIADIILVLPVLVWLIANRPRELLWFLPPLVCLASSTLAYNVWWFGNVLGGLNELEQLHPQRHALPTAWTWNVTPGLAGTLVSPSRGLWVFQPWVLVSILVLPGSWGCFGKTSLSRVMIVALLPYLFVVSAYSVWWGGFCYGPRYWTEATPVLTIVLAGALEWGRARARWLLLVMAGAIVWSIALQTLGAFWYPSSWNLNPNNVDTHHERLWNWVDCEVTRCLFEKVLSRK